MWESIAEGDTDYVPDIQLEPGQFYRLTISLPFEIPEWALGPVLGLLGNIGGAVEIVGTTLTISFQA